MTNTTLEQLFDGAVVIENGSVTVKDSKKLASAHMDTLVREAVFGEGDVRENARWLIWELAQQVGIRPASIHDLYIARGRGECGGFTVPAINVRGMAYDTARAIFRTAIKLNAGAFICEIARSEIAYTEQRPAEYVSVILAAALREGFQGPVFIQGDHFQLNAKKFKANPGQEVDAVKQLAREAIAAGFYNIDIDTSTLVDLSKPTLEEQQAENVEQAVELATFIRSLEPQGVTISLGGEIGEVGTENSTPEELRAYMDGFNALLEKRAPGTIGLSKISVQSGTSHGGVVLPDGSIADVKIDFDTLSRLSEISQKDYRLAGAVQHGASTLPDSMFHKFPPTGTCEIHLATNFQTMLYDHMPQSLRDEIYTWLDVNAKDERKPSDTDEQFYYKTRKKALGPFKRQIWDLPADIKAKLASAYDAKFEFLFTQLNIANTTDVVAKYVKAPEIHRPMPHADLPVVEAAPDDADLSD
jgi:fructose-bisphosphate aldolase class II